MLSGFGGCPFSYRSARQQGAFVRVGMGTKRQILKALGKETLTFLVASPYNWGAGMWKRKGFFACFSVHGGRLALCTLNCVKELVHGALGRLRSG